MVTKPLMIAPETKSPDYTGFVRNTVSRSFGLPPGTPASFAAAMQAQQTQDSHEVVTGGAVPPPLPASLTPLRGAGTQADGVVASDTAAKGKAMDNGPRAMALDARSLNTLQRMSQRGGRATRSVNPEAAAMEISVPQRQRSVQQREAQTQASVAVPKASAPAPAAPPAQTVASGGGETESTGLGKLSAQFESGSKGIEAIGYDRNGGTSYGKYQISSRQGSFARFLEYAEREAPDIAQRLRKAGKANTGSRRGAVPNEWVAIAQEQPERFEQLQEGFIRQSHYTPAASEVQKSLGGVELSPTMREVVWSTAVQHGPTGAARLFERAVQRLTRSGKSPQDEKALIETLYSLRKGQFASSTPHVQAAVRQRFDVEQRQALAMLQGKTVLS